MGWIMSSERTKDGTDFYIGAVKVAEIRFLRKRPDKGWDVMVSFWKGEHRVCSSMSAALKHMHKMLKMPPGVPDETHVDSGADAQETDRAANNRTGQS